MIYDRFNNPIRITGYCGKHKADGRDVPMILVRTTHAEDGSEWHYFAWTLKADGDPAEIDAAVELAPEVTLSGAELAKAIHQAE